MQSLFTRLKREGFVLGVDTHLRIQYLLQNEGKNYLHEIEDVKYLLAPIIAHDKEAKLKFYDVFEDFLEEIKQKKKPYLRQVETDEENIKNKNRKRFQNYQRLNRLLLLLLPFLAILGFIISTQIVADIEQSKAQLYITSSDGKRFPQEFIERENIPDTFYIRRYVGENLSYHIDRASIPWDLKGTKIIWDFGDGESRTLVDTARIYAQEEKIHSQSKGDTTYLIKLQVIHPIDPGKNLYSYAFLELTCPELKVDGFKSVIGRDENFNLRPTLAELDAIEDFEYYWDLGDNNLKSGSQLTHKYDSVGKFGIRLNAIKRNPLGIRCRDSLIFVDTISVIDTLSSGRIFESSAEFENPEILYQFTSLTIGFISFFLSGLLIGTFLLIKTISYKPPTEENSILFKGEEESPFVIHFPNQDYLISHESGIYELAALMRQRRLGNIKKINLLNSIKSTIRESGFPKLFYETSSRPSEYLVLIEQQHPDSHLSRFLERILNILKGEDVLLSRFFFDGNPRICWNEQYPMGVHLEELARKYPKHRLLIISDCHQLIDSHYPEINPWVEKAFESWKENRVILTPVPVIDWGYKERILIETMDLLPLEIRGQLHMIQMFDEIGQPSFEDHKKNLLDLYSETSYGVREYELDTVEGLKKYLGTLNFQWLAATMVYPLPNWEVTLAIGNDLSHEKEQALLTYENLLKLARIPWMQSGEIPRPIRQNLLASLDPEVELLARNTILSLLREVPTKEGSYASQKLSIQKTTNQFYLNPGDDKIAQEMYFLMERRNLTDPIEQKRLNQNLDVLYGSRASRYLTSKFGKTTSRDYIIGAVLGFIAMLISSFWMSNFPAKKYDEFKWFVDKLGSDNTWIETSLFVEKPDQHDVIASLGVNSEIENYEDPPKDSTNRTVENEEDNTPATSLEDETPIVRTGGGILKIGIIKYKSSENFIETYASFTNFLAGELNRKAVIDTVPEDELSFRLANGQYDIGIFTVFPYLKAKLDFPELKVFASHTVNGEDSYSGCIIVRKESGINSIHQLRDKNFLFVKPSSTSGYKYPKGIFEERNLDIDAGFFEYGFSGSHEASLISLLNKEVDGIAVDTRVYEALSDLDKQGLTMLECYKIPYHAYVLAPEVDSILKAELEQIMFIAHKNPANRSLFKNPLKIEKWHPQSDEAYNSLRRYLRIVREKPSVHVSWEIRNVAQKMLDERGDLLELLQESCLNKLTSTYRFKEVSDEDTLIENAKEIKVTLGVLDQQLHYNFYLDETQIGEGNLNVQQLVSELPTALIIDVLKAYILEGLLLFNGESWFVTFGLDDGVNAEDYTFEIQRDAGLKSLLSGSEISRITSLNTFFKSADSNSFKEGQKVRILYNDPRVADLEDSQGESAFWDNLDNIWGVVGLIVALFTIILGSFLTKRRNNRHKKFLKELNSILLQFWVSREEVDADFISINEQIHKSLQKNNISENQFLILNKRYEDIEGIIQLGFLDELRLRETDLKEINEIISTKIINEKDFIKIKMLLKKHIR